MAADTLQAENEELRRKLEEAEETINAIRSGAVDALVVEGAEGDRVYTLEAADRPYRLFVEQMQQGAATLLADGTIVYCNRQFADLIKVPHEKLIGAALHSFIAADDRAIYENLLWQGQMRSGRAEARLQRTDGGSVPAYLTFNSLPKESGAAIGVLVTDLTAQRHHEQLADALDKLQQSEAALRESEVRFRSIADTAPMLVWLSGPDKLCHFFNKAWLDFTGRSLEQELGNGWVDGVHPQDMNGALETYTTAFDAREVFEMEYRLRHHTGQYRWIFDRGVPRFDANGIFEGYIGSVIDVHERKQVEKALRENEERFRNMADNISQLAWTCDRLGNVTWYNKRWLEYTGLTFEQMKDWGWKQVHHPEHVDRVVASVTRSRETGEPWEDTFPLRGSDGRYRWFLSRAAPIRDDTGKVVRWFGTNTDITEQLEAEQALRESEARFRNMADHAPVMIWVTEADGACSFLSQSWYDFTGETAETGLGFDWFEAAHPDDRESAYRIFIEANSKRETFRLEYRLRRRDGEYRWVIDAAAPRFSETGEFLGFIGSVIDITERKRAEETQRLLVGELNHRVKNTLASVQAIIQHTLRQTQDPREFASAFAGRIQSMARVHYMLSTATWQGADLRGLIRDQLLHGPVDETRITAWGPTVRLEPQLALHMALMLHELGTNANKYGALSLPGGRVAIGWTVEDAWLHLRWEERGGPAVRAPTKRGFGTSLIEQSTKGEGGSARMSVEAEGVTWEVKLPLPGPAAIDAARLRTREVSSKTEQVQIAEQEPCKLAGQRFLVVEDEPLVALDIAADLENAGAEVVASTGSAKQALEIIESRELDAALLDGNLNGRPVGEIAAALTRSNVPFLFVTGYGRESLPQPFRNASVLSKPFSPQQLIEAVARLVKRRGDVVHLREN
jgi:PAS domain S-box-containing protein